ncbi:MAG: hypothetical protein HDT32_03290 [Clostridiales bacterium]|nr:hypothetical protein [Clostridiales bacterium]
MKKKLVAVVALVLVVVLACSLAACNNSKSMFDGNFTKEASKEEAASTWKSAASAMGSDSEELATASEEDSFAVKGWKGMKLSYSATNSSSSTNDGTKREISSDIKSEGALLFDGSAMAVTGTSTMSADGKTETAKVGTYTKDSVLYTSISYGESALKVKFTDDLGTFGKTIKDSLTEMTDFTSLALDYIGEIICEMPYDEIVKEYGDFKAYIDNSGKYNRVKYVFNDEMMTDLFGSSSDKATFSGECSVIIVTDKDGAFQGVKLETTYSLSEKDEEAKYESSRSMTLSSSIEKCDEIDSSLPEDLADYKDVKDMTLTEVMEFFSSIVGQ